MADLGISYKKDENFGEWYRQADFEAETEEMELESCTYPLFVTRDSLEREKNHIEGFAPEVAWVTEAGKSELKVRLGIRPTSEAIMSKEFLWQEGHTAFATKEEADHEVQEILEMYRKMYEEYLAVPVVKGQKTKLEKFAGALYTTSVEAFIPNAGRGIQGATSHCLGQNFAKMFDIKFENEMQEKAMAMVWQNSWDYTTRTAIVIPVIYKDVDTEAILEACRKTVLTLKKAGFRVKADLSTTSTPGQKYWHWEMKGVPLRIEIGQRDLDKNQVRIVRRDNSEKVDIPLNNDLVERVKNTMDRIQQNMFDVARRKRDACIQVARTWDEFMEVLNQKKMILAPWCDEMDVEEEVKKRTKGEGEMGAAKSLCTPFEQPELPEGTLCFASGKPARKWTYWGRTY
ncbi:hypothetical protein ACLB2K_010804 [Fragaria x ananassa]